MPRRSRTPSVWPYSRAVTKTSCPRASSRSISGRSTSGWAAAVQSTQTLIAGDLRESAGRRERSDRRRRELRVERVALHQAAGALGERLLLGLELAGEGGRDHGGDLGHVLLDQAAGGQRRRADAQAGGVHRWT